MAESDGKLALQRDGGAVTVVLSGDFSVSKAFPEAASLPKGASGLSYDAAGLGKWDSSLVAALHELEEKALASGMSIDRSGLPSKLSGMLALASAVVRPASKAAEGRDDPFSRVGALTTAAWHDFLEYLDFSGTVTIAFWNFIRGKSRMRGRDFWITMQTVSVEALAIVSLISFLVGLIIAFLGAVVLKRFGAEFAIAYLVGYGVLREMGAIMTGVIMAGRTGAAYAAEIGSMKVSEEVDALRTLGISPVEFLVLPRVLALVLMMPVLTIFADLIGIVGGYLVAVIMMGVPSSQFLTGMDFVASGKDIALGLFKGAVFGVLVATAGCLRGMQCSASADAVGRAATRAVVLSITLIIFANALIDWMAAFLGI
jgi:phospholipid/cholesterol/gamma-HCH transport system permease protein